MKDIKMTNQPLEIIETINPEKTVPISELKEIGCLIKAKSVEDSSFFFIDWNLDTFSEKEIIESEISFQPFNDDDISIAKQLKEIQDNYDDSQIYLDNLEIVRLYLYIEPVQVVDLKSTDYIKRQAMSKLSNIEAEALGLLDLKVLYKLAKP